MKKSHYLYLGLFLFAFLVGSAPRAEAGCLLKDGTLGFGGSGERIQSLQLCLIAGGFPIPAGATGYYGEQTKQAVQRFYADELGLGNWNGLSVGPLGKAKLSGLATASGEYKKAGSEAEFKKYLAEYDVLSKREFVNDGMVAVESMGLADSADEKSASTPSRVSETTVQVAGVDEPDIVKIDGKNIFYSQMNWFLIDPMPFVRTGGAESDMVDTSDKMFAPVPANPGSTRVIEAFPPEDLKVVEKIKETGDLLIHKSSNTLIVLSYPEIVAYNITEADSPKKLWDLKINENTSVVTARMTNDKIYLVTETWLSTDRPCPMPLIAGAESITIPCGDVYVPMTIEPVSHTYNLLKVDPVSGKVEDKLAVASEGGMTTVMVSKDNLYLATHDYSDNTEVMIEVLRKVADKSLDAEVKAKIAKISSYDISPLGKLNEIQLVISSAWDKLSSEERLKAESNFNNAVASELALKQRDLETTRIARIPLASFVIAATGKVPGTLLNQFSMDEYNGDLRVSTTIGENNWWFGWGANSNSVNDIYVLGSDLVKKGEILDLGKGERIYSTRFMGDQGYVVTFRQIDPFYVLDLSNPSAPKQVGELKIPGYSSYLEKISENLVLGVGRENNNVKLSLFDVSIPSAPKEVSKYLLKDEWSEVEGNHHAFMLDAENKTFFIPGGQGGYFFSYDNDKLELAAAISQNGVARALFIDDYYYLVGQEAVKVIDLKTWKEVEKLEF